MDSESFSKRIKAEALRLGFFACGIAKAAPVEQQVANHYRQWIAHGGHADMNYLAEHLDMRLNPLLLLPQAQSIVVVAMSYVPATPLPEDEYQLAAYAYGKDYHDVLKARLRLLCEAIERQKPEHEPSPTFKICTDTVPIHERYWAQQAGLGFVGRNHQLIIPHAGSMFFLGEVVTTAVFDDYDGPMASRCGNCQRCIKACSTGALQAESAWFCAEKCLSYQTIENRGEIAEELKDKLGSTIYGCDRCQKACPWNRFATPGNIPELQPSVELLNMKREDWHHLTEDDYRRLFKGSAVKRAKYAGLMRNIRAVEANGQSATPPVGQGEPAGKV